MPDTTFTPGQTVWVKTTKQPATIVAVDGNLAWARPISGGFGWLMLFDQLTATEPANEAKPQNCPFCRSKADVMGEDGDRALCMVYCVMKAQCGLEGPFRKTRREAIQAWNLIQLATLPVDKDRNTAS